MPEVLLDDLPRSPGRGLLVCGDVTDGDQGRAQVLDAGDDALDRHLVVLEQGVLLRDGQIPLGARGRCPLDPDDAVGHRESPGPEPELRLVQGDEGLPVDQAGPIVQKLGQPVYSSR